MIRLAKRTDVPRILDIYAPYILNTCYSFEYEVPSLQEFEARFDNITRDFPWLVYEENGLVQGYAYAALAFERKAYQWDADMSIYLDSSAQRHGVGNKLYSILENELRLMGYRNAYALVTGINHNSLRFHEKRGYILDAIFPNTGYKMGQWLDLYWYRLPLLPYDDPAAAPSRFEKLHL